MEGFSVFTKHDSRPDLSFSPEVTHRDQARDTLIRNQPLERKGIGRKLTHSRNQNPKFYTRRPIGSMEGFRLAAQLATTGA